MFSYKTIIFFLFFSSFALSLHNARAEEVIIHCFEDDFPLDKHKKVYKAEFMQIKILDKIYQLQDHMYFYHDKSGNMSFEEVKNLDILSEQMFTKIPNKINSRITNLGKKPGTVWLKFSIHNLIKTTHFKVRNSIFWYDYIEFYEYDNRISSYHQRYSGRSVSPNLNPSKFHYSGDFPTTLFFNQAKTIYIKLKTGHDYLLSFQFMPSTNYDQEYENDKNWHDFFFYGTFFIILLSSIICFIYRKNNENTKNFTIFIFFISSNLLHKMAYHPIGYNIFLKYFPELNYRFETVGLGLSYFFLLHLNYLFFKKYIGPRLSLVFQIIKIIPILTALSGLFFSYYELNFILSFMSWTKWISTSWCLFICLLFYFKYGNKKTEDHHVWFTIGVIFYYLGLVLHHYSIHGQIYFLPYGYILTGTMVAYLMLSYPIMTLLKEGVNEKDLRIIKEKELTIKNAVIATINHDIPKMLSEASRTLSLKIMTCNTNPDINTEIKYVSWALESTHYVINNLIKTTKFFFDDNRNNQGHNQKFPILVHAIIDNYIKYLKNSAIDMSVSFTFDKINHFCFINRGAFQLLLITTLNNSYEAGSTHWEVKLTTEEYPGQETFDGMTVLNIIDNGRGITQIEKHQLLSDQRYTSKKNKDIHGIGINLMKEIIKSVGGLFDINKSPQGQGTMITIKLPHIKNYGPFIDLITIPKTINKIVILDSDAIFRGKWVQKIKSSTKRDFEITQFESIDSCIDTLSKHKKNDLMLFTDYQFKNTTQKGIDVIKKTNIIKGHAFLLTDYPDNIVTLKECMDNKIHYIFKTFSDCIAIKEE